MNSSRPRPNCLVITHRPWLAWCFGAVSIAFAIFMMVLMIETSEMQCQRDEGQ